MFPLHFNNAFIVSIIHFIYHNTLFHKYSSILLIMTFLCHNIYVITHFTGFTICLTSIYISHYNHFINNIQFSFSPTILYRGTVPCKAMLNHLFWFKMAFIIFSFIYVIQHDCWHQSFQDFFSCFAFYCISLHSERYYALSSILLRISSYSITRVKFGEFVSKSLGGFFFLLVLTTAFGGYLVSSSESSAESLVSPIVLEESFPKPEQESAEGHSFGRSFTLA